MAIEIGRINVGNAGYGDNQLYVTYDLLSQSVASNSSNVRVYLYFHAPVWISFSSASAYLHNSGWFSIATSFGAGEHHLCTFDITINHNSDGTGSFNVGYGINTSFLVSGSGSCGASLPRIPRASEINAFDAFDIEGNIKIGINKKYHLFTDTIELLIDDTVIKTISNYTNNTVFTLNEEEKDIVFELMKTCNTADFIARVTTYSGTSVIGQSIGKAKGTIYNANPLFSIATWESVNYLDLASSQTIIKGYSTIIVTLTKAVAQKKATISSYKVICGSSISQSENLLHKLENVDDSIIKCYAIDSRGNTTEVLLNVDNYIQYTPVTLDALSADRKSSENGTDVTLSFGGNIWVGDFGILSNVIQVQYFYKELSSGLDWIQGTSVIDPELNDNYQIAIDVKGDLGASGFDKGKAYEIKVIVSDRLSNKERTTELTKFHGLMYFHENGIGIGGEYDNSLTDVNGKSFPIQFWNSEFQMMIPIDVFVLEDKTKYIVDGRETTLKSEIKKRGINL